MFVVIVNMGNSSKMSHVSSQVILINTLRGQFKQRPSTVRVHDTNEKIYTRNYVPVPISFQIKPTLESQSLTGVWINFEIKLI